MFEDTKVWASNIFKTANLGDLRRTKRLIKLTSDLSSSIGQKSGHPYIEPHKINNLNS